MLHDYGSRDRHFIQVNERIRERLVDLIGGRPKHVCIPLQGSGTFVVEAMLVSYVPDASVAGDEVEHGARPKPFMVYRNLDLMDVHPIQSVLKVDDTISGVGEALEAGCWGVGIARYSNYMDIDSLDHVESLPESEIQRRLAVTREILQKTGAHYVIDTFDQLPDVIEDVNLRLGRGETP